MHHLPLCLAALLALLSVTGELWAQQPDAPTPPAAATPPAAPDPPAPAQAPTAPPINPPADPKTPPPTPTPDIEPKRKDGDPSDPVAPPGSDGAPRFDDKGRPIEKSTDTPPRQKITLPELVEYAAPIYPAAAKEAGLVGAVILKLEIDTGGKVVSAVVLEGAGHGFDEAALAAASSLVFTPARKADGTPFSAFIRYRYRFELQEEDVPAVVTEGILKGKVLIRGLEEPLAGATLTLTASEGVQTPDSSRTFTTDANGGFDIGTLPAGSYRIQLEALGHEQLVITEQVVAGEETTVTYRLIEKADPEALVVYVQGERPPREVTRRTIEKREIERIPGTNGDALRSIQSLPGVARPPGLIGALLIRGSAPFDSQTFIDGVFVPLIYHFGGLSSVVPTELLSKIDFYPGNFSAKYGRAMGGIVDAGIRSPRSDGYHGLLQVDLIDARLMAEGPIPLLEDWTFAVAGRRSWLDAWLGPVLEEAGAGVTTAPRYYDYQAIVEGKPTGKDRFRTTFYGSDDRLEILLADPAANEPALSGTVGFVSAFERLSFAYENQFTPEDAVSATVALGRDNLEFGLSQFFFTVEAFDVLSRIEYSRKLMQQATMNLGIDIYSGGFDVALRLPAPPAPGQPPNQPFSTRTAQQIAETSYFLQPAGYVEFELTPNARTRIVPGVRLDYTESSERFDLSPRINGRYTLFDTFPTTVLKGGVGVFHQPPRFEQVREPLGTPGTRSNRSIHYGLGVEQDITQQINASVDGFYKQLDDLVVAEASTSGTAVEYTNDAFGYVVGAEVLLKYKPDDRFFGWLAYTLSRSARQNGPEEPEYLVTWDQTHILTVLGSYRLPRGWEFGARFRLVSGNLTSPNVCDFTSEQCDPNRINALYHGATGAYTPIRFGATNSERLPMFHQLDLRVDKHWQFTHWKFSMYLDIQNSYNSPNVEGLLYNFNFTDRQYVTGIPILPSIGMRGEI